MFRIPPLVLLKNQLFIATIKSKSHPGSFSKYFSLVILQLAHDEELTNSYLETKMTVQINTLEYPKRRCYVKVSTIVGKT